MGWHKFSTIKSADGKVGFDIGAGINSYGDGPERIVGRAFGFSDADLAVAMAARTMLDALQEVEKWLDLNEDEMASLLPVDRMSHEKHLTIVRAAIAKALGQKAASQ